MNTPQKIRNASRTLVWDREQEAFGETHADEHDADQSALPRTVRGLRTSTLIQPDARLRYDNTLGRDIEADLLGFGRGPNLFGYAAENPTQAVDRMGQSPLTKSLSHTE